MLIQGSVNTNKTDLLVEKYQNLLKSGVSEDEILVVVLNGFKKAEFIKKLVLKESKYQNITTFWGLAYKAFNENWEYIANLIGVDSQLKPNLCGLEVSQFIFKQSIKEADFSDYISKVNLLHQLFRRYSLIVQNNLSLEEVKKRSDVLDEVFAIDAQKAIEDYKLKTIQYRSFDYLRQLAVMPIIYKNTDYFKNIKYLLVDDADEYSYALWLFIDEIIPYLNDYMITYDENGSSRCGYLCAYKNGVNEFIKKYNPKLLKIKDKSAFSEVAEKFYKNIKTTQKFVNESFSYCDSVKRLDMFEKVISDVKNLIKNGVKPSEISIVSPLIDEVLVEAFKNSDCGLEFQILSGSEKLIEFKFIKHILYVIKLAQKKELQAYEIKSLLVELLNIPYKKCYEIINECVKSKSLIPYKFQEKHYDYAYQKLLSVVNSLEVSPKKLSEQIQVIYNNIIKEFNSEIDKSKYDFLVKEAQSFEYAFENNLVLHSNADSSANVENICDVFISQIENSVISENPADIVKINTNKIIVSTPQKIIDFGYKTKYQMWLDMSHNEWLKQDTGTLYNAWVFNRDWDNAEYTLDDNIKLTQDKTGRIVRKLILCAQNSISFYSSLYDNLGNENFGGLTDFIELEKNNKPLFNIVPRDDQKPVLDYHKGNMGILAVPGAGKTTILLALIIKLIKQGVSAENIFVLTYMESAAKNFKERIKLALPDNPTLPNISTIHGLALRIIKENGNYNKIGLDENFEICDDNLKEKFIKEIFYKLKIDDEKYDNFLRCVSIVKLANLKEIPKSKYKEIQEFFNFYNEYNKTLKQNNLIDYDDMLCFAVKLLEENSSIKHYYQNLCKYVIEDEAQDSTFIQQKLIKLLTGKYNNFVRCGDINQAITSTFTDSNLTNFKNFVDKNNKVEMTTSQRCCKDVYELANNLVNTALLNKDSQNAFYNIQMQGTLKNPDTVIKPQYLIFEKEDEEKLYIINKVKEILTDNPKASIAILLRLNHQVNEYCEFFAQNGIKTAVRTDCLMHKGIYKLIIGMLKIIQSPLNNNLIIEFAKDYTLNNLYDFMPDEFEFIKNLKTPFINMNSDDIPTEGLLQLYWDIDYWLNNSTISTDNLVLKIGEYYSKNTTDKSNTYLTVTAIRRLIDKEDVIKGLEYFAQKPTSLYKFFDEENTTEGNNVSIMTMHKSKGDEFDYVFCPNLNAENYPDSIGNAKLKSGGHFIQTIKNVVYSTGIKTQDEMKLEQIEETLRLLYVGITRAKKGLILSNAKNYLRRKNTKNLDILQKIV